MCLISNNKREVERKDRKRSVMSRSISHSCKLFRGEDNGEDCHGDKDRVVLDIKKLRFNDGIKVSSLKGKGHRVSVALQPDSSDPDDNSKAIVLKITDQGISDLLRAYQNDLEITTFYQALKDYAAFIFLKSIAEKSSKRSGGKLNIFFPETRIVCLDSAQIKEIFTDIDKRATYFPYVLNSGKGRSNPFIFAVAQEFVGMVPLNKDQLQQYNDEIEFMSSNIRDLHPEQFTSEFSNVKYAPQRRELVAFDIELDQLSCLNLMAHVSNQTRFQTANDIMNSKVLKEAFNVGFFSGFDFESIKTAEAESEFSHIPKKMVISFSDNPFMFLVEADESPDSNEESSQESSQESSEESSPEPKSGKRPISLRTSIP